MASRPTFDEALPLFVDLAVNVFGDQVLESSIFLRDAFGRLTLVLRENTDLAKRAEFDANATSLMGPYVDGPSSTPEELFDDSLFSDSGVIDERVLTGRGAYFVKLVDRKIVGQDWNRPDFTPVEGPVPIVTFFSVKGGVGRSTALAVAAAYFSDIGKNVLVLDLDLEAPGLGAILIPNFELPDYGASDYFIENRLRPVSDEFLENCIAPSPLTHGRGLVEVMPAVGLYGFESPAGIIPKLGRVFLDSPTQEDEAVSFLGQTRALVERLIARGRSDVIFVDARAGLSESSAASVLGLGGEILMFGVDTPQTFEGYGYLFSHLARFAQSPSDVADWRYRLHMVHAKARRGAEAASAFREQAYFLFAESIYEEATTMSADVFNFDIDDPSAPHYPWVIPFDAEYTEFDPTSRRDQLGRDFFERSFEPFLQRLGKVLFPAEDDE